MAKYTQPPAHGDYIGEDRRGGDWNRGGGVNGQRGNETIKDRRAVFITGAVP